MAINDNVTRNQYTATAAQTVFAYTFEIFDDDDITVDQGGTILTKGTHYSVSGVGVSSGGNITLVSGATSGDIMTIYRSMALERLTDYQQNGDFLAAAVNDDYDRLWAGMQQVRSTANTGIRPAVDDAALDSSNTELADIATRGGKVLGFTQSGAIDYVSAAIPSGDFTDVSTTSAMTAISSPSVGDVVQTAEFATGKGGGGTYDAVLTSSVTPNTFNIIVGVSDALISFVLRIDSHIYLTTFGGNLGTAAVQSTRLQAAVDAVDPGVVYLDQGTYQFSATLTITTKCSIIGLGIGTGGQAKTTITFSGAATFIKSTRTYGTFKGFEVVDTNNGATSTIAFDLDASFQVLEDIYVSFFDLGFRANGSTLTQISDRFYNCFVDRCEVGCFFTECNNFTMTGCFLTFCNFTVKMDQCTNMIWDGGSVIQTFGNEGGGGFRGKETATSILFSMTNICRNIVIRDSYLECRSDDIVSAKTQQKIVKADTVLEGFIFEANWVVSSTATDETATYFDFSDSTSTGIYIEKNNFRRFPPTVNIVTGATSGTHTKFEFVIRGNILSSTNYDVIDRSTTIEVHTNGTEPSGITYGINNANITCDGEWMRVVGSVSVTSFGSAGASEVLSIANLPLAEKNDLTIYTIAEIVDASNAQYTFGRVQQGATEARIFKAGEVSFQVTHAAATQFFRFNICYRYRTTGT